MVTWALCLRAYNRQLRAQARRASLAWPLTQVLNLRVPCGTLIFVESTVFISSAFAQTAPAAAVEGGMMSSLTSMLPLVLMFVVLYFVMIRPQMRKQKEHRNMVEALTKGDEVATAGGLLGKVSRLGEGYLTLEIAPGVEVQLQRSAVVQVLPKGSAAGK